MSKLNNVVTKFLNELNHPLRKEIDKLRSIIVNSRDGLTENIKWNGPNYCFGNEDRITIKIQPPKSIQLIFHRGAKKQVQPKSKLINDNSKLLAWRENDRAIATFNSIVEIERSESALSEVVNKWIDATK